MSINKGDGKVIKGRMGRQAIRLDTFAAPVNGTTFTVDMSKYSSTVDAYEKNGDVCIVEAFMLTVRWDISGPQTVGATAEWRKSMQERMAYIKVFHDAADTDSLIYWPDDEEYANGGAVNFWSFNRLDNDACSAIVELCGQTAGSFPQRASNTTNGTQTSTDPENHPAQDNLCGWWGADVRCMVHATNNGGGFNMIEAGTSPYDFIVWPATRSPGDGETRGYPFSVCTNSQKPHKLRIKPESMAAIFGVGTTFDNGAGGSGPVSIDLWVLLSECRADAGGMDDIPYGMPYRVEPASMTSSPAIFEKNRNYLGIVIPPKFRSGVTTTAIGGGITLLNPYEPRDFTDYYQEVAKLWYEEVSPEGSTVARRFPYDANDLHTEHFTYMWNQGNRGAADGRARIRHASQIKIPQVGARYGAVLTHTRFHPNATNCQTYASVGRSYMGYDQLGTILSACPVFVFGCFHPNIFQFPGGPAMGEGIQCQPRVQWQNMSLPDGQNQLVTVLYDVPSIIDRFRANANSCGPCSGPGGTPIAPLKDAVIAPTSKAPLVAEWVPSIQLPTAVGKV